MGLLDGFSEFVKTPEGQGLLSAVAGGMAGARRGAPINSLGIGGLAGLRGYTGAIDQAARQDEQNAVAQYRNAQLKKMQDDQARQAAQEAARAQALSALPVDQRQAVDAGVPFADIWKHQNPADNKPQLVTVQTPQGPMQRWMKPGETTGSDVGAPVDKEAALPWYARKGPDGRIAIDPAFAELEKTKASFGRAPAQPMQPVAYIDDKGNTIWGTINDARGKGAANFSPAVQGAVAGAKEGAKITAKTQTEAAFDAPRVVQVAETAIRHVDDLLAHPGFGQAVGKSSMLGIQNIPGTDAKDFMNRLDQVKGGAFLEAFNQLKGGGQITEIEGKKATDALARMNNSSSESEFKAAAEDFQKTVRMGMNRANLRAGNRQPAAPNPGGAKFLGFE